ncbi:MAG TPA: nitronate monooxygenase [Schlesneria sp.]
MWNETRLAEQLGVRYPIIQGPFGGGASSVQLTTTVSNAGGLGSYGAESVQPEKIGRLVAEIRSKTEKPFAVNLWVPMSEPTGIDRDALVKGEAAFDKYFKECAIELPPLPEQIIPKYEDQVRALLDAAPPVFSFVYGAPEPEIIKECRRRAIFTVGTATTVQEGVFLEEAGVDCIVATGIEAGGHRPSFLRSAEISLTGMVSLVPQLVDHVRVPVIAAGGIADGRGIRAAIALGAEGVQIGTAFLACDESAASPEHRRELFGPSRSDTILTRAFTGRLARTIRNRLTDELAKREDELAPYPMQVWLAGLLKVSALQRSDSSLISLWAGQSASLVRHRKANDLMEELVRGAVR